MKTIFTILLLNWNFLGANYLNGYDSDKIKKSFPVEINGTLEVNTSSGNVTLKSWDKNEVQIEVEGIHKHNLKKLIIENNANKVSVTYDPDWGWDNACFTITIPQKFNTEINTSGGDVDLQGSIKGLVQTKTSGGNIVSTVVWGNAELITSGGNIICDKISGVGFVKTSGGDIKFKSIGEKIDAQTSGGDIEIDEIGGNAIIKTSGGDIEIGNVKGQLEAITSGGDIFVGDVFSNAILKTSGGNINLKSANGLVEAKTSGGDIYFHKIKGKIIAHTSGGKFKGELIPDGESEIKTVGGDINLSVPSDAKATIIAKIDNKWKWRRDHEIESDFKIDEYEKTKISVRSVININGGGKEIYLKSVDGDIIIKKSK